MTLDLNTDFSKLTGARQTMSSWSKVVESFESMPEVFKDSYKSALGDVTPFPYVVFAPPMGHQLRPGTGKLICQVQDSIFIWENTGGDRVALVEYPLKAISDLEIGIVLLYSWFTISGMNQTGKASSSRVEFNTATARHLAPITNKMRPRPINVGESEQDVEEARFDFLGKESFKFMSFARESLVHGEKVLKVLSQPKISKPIISLGKYVLYQTTISVEHLLILTDQEVIVIQDDERSGETRGRRYGGKWQYISLRHIESVSLLTKDSGLLSLVLTLTSGGKQTEIVFAASKLQEVVEFQAELEKLTRSLG